MAVARRLDVPIVGLGVPTRFMIKYDGAQAPEGRSGKDVIVNPFEGWKVTTPEEIGTSIPSFDPEDDLLPHEPRETIDRMLRNLESDFEEVGDPRRAEEVGKYRSLLGDSNDSSF